MQLTKFLRTLQQVRENFKSADEDGDDVITRGQFRVFVDANAEIDFAMSKQIKRMRAYQRAFGRVDLDLGDRNISAERRRTADRNQASSLCDPCLDHRVREIPRVARPFEARQRQALNRPRLHITDFY